LIPPPAWSHAAPAGIKGSLSTSLALEDAATEHPWEDENDQ
jgi:hypothetical protein